MQKKLFLTFALTVMSVLADIKIPKEAIPQPQGSNNEFKYKLEAPGVLKLNTKGTFYDDGTSRLDGSGSLYKNLVDHRDPMKIGGGLKYNHYPSDLGASLNVQNAEHRGTRVQGELSRTLLKDRFTNIEGGLRYKQTFNTPFGNSEPYYGAFIRGTF